MRNHYSWWQYAIIGIIVLVGIVYALPNLYGKTPAVQISTTRAAVLLDDSLYARVISKLEAEQLPLLSAELAEQRLLVRFPDTDTQLKAADVLTTMLGRDYIVAHNLAPATPGFMQSMDMDPMNLGLDLRGGLHFLIQVDMAAAIVQAEESYVESLRILLRDERIRWASLGRDNSGGVKVSLRSTEDRDKALTTIRSEFPDLQVRESEPGSDIVLAMSEQEIEEKRQFALQQNITILRNRVNELGVAEPIIQRQGDDRIVVQLPGVQDTARAKELLGATATLEFRLVDEDNDPQQAASTGRIPLNSRLYRERNGRPQLLQKRVLLTGDYIIDAASGIEQQTGRPAVFITLDGKGANRFENGTKDNIGKLLAVLFIENKTETKLVNGELKREEFKVEEIINVATIQDQLGRRFQITGLDSTTEARDLALLLRAGALAAPISIVEERTVGPSAGQDNIDQGFNSALIAFALVLLFMAAYYRRFGLVSDLALVINVVLMISVLSILQATLTLPGIAGIILTMGMAVDANVLIFERIREELKLGNTPQAAIHTGFSRALGTILDANITTFIAAIVLFSFGTGPIKGFAVTLSIGIVTSVFTAVVVARSAINFMYGGRSLQTLSI